MRVSIAVIVLAAAVTFAACGSYSTVPPNGQGSGGSATTGHGAGGGSTGKGAGGSAASNGSGGSFSTSSAGGGSASQSAGHPVADFVAAGSRSTAGTHTAVSTLGESPGGNGVSRSPKHQFVGGLIAAVTQP